MKRKLLDILACPMCKKHPLELIEIKTKNDEIVEGAIYCDVLQHADARSIRCNLTSQRAHGEPHKGQQAPALEPGIRFGAKEP